MILDALLRGESVTKLDAFRMGAGLSVNSRIAELRKRGYEIDCSVERRNGRNVWVYSLRGQLPLRVA